MLKNFTKQSSQKENFEGNVSVKHLADGGQGFFKIIMSIFSEDYIPNSKKETFDSNSEFIVNENNKRTLYSEGGTVSKKACLLGVRRSLILCIVPKSRKHMKTQNYYFT